MTERILSLLASKHLQSGRPGAGEVRQPAKHLIRSGTSHTQPTSMEITCPHGLSDAFQFIDRDGWTGGRVTNPLVTLSLRQQAWTRRAWQPSRPSSEGSLKTATMSEAATPLVTRRRSRPRSTSMRSLEASCRWALLP